MKHLRAICSCALPRRAALFSALILFVCAIAPPSAFAADDFSDCDSTVTFTALSGKQGYAGENYSNLFDNNTETKWCVTVLNDSPAEVVFKTSKQGVVKGYTITTANDNTINRGRNPYSWKLYGSTSADGEWTLIEEVTEDATMQDVNFTPFTFKVADPGTSKFDYFKWVVTKVKSGTTLQVSELKLLMVTCYHKNADGTSALGEVISSKEATCTEYAYEIRRCSVCGEDVKVITSAAYAPHHLTKCDGWEATCTEYGSKDYYECSVCGGYFLDQEGTKKITLEETNINPKGHYFKNGTCVNCDLVDDRFNAITRKGVDVCVRNFPFVFHWEYDTDNKRIASTNRAGGTSTDFELELYSDSAYQLTFDYGTLSNNEYADDLKVRIDGRIFTVLNNAEKKFSYVFGGREQHFVQLTFTKESSLVDSTCCGYIKNIVATTDIDTTNRVDEMYCTLDADTVTIKYGPIQLPCVVYESGADISLASGVAVKIDASMKNFEITDMSGFFTPFSPTSIEGLENLNTSKVTDMSGMFSGCDYLTQLDLSSFDTKNVTDMESMFYDCELLTQLDLSSFDTQNVTDMSRMFYSCDSLKQIKFSPLFCTKNVEDMNRMFYGCYIIKQLDLSSFDTQNVTDMESMFENCDSLKQIEFSPLFSTKNVENMESMFENCVSLEQLDLSFFDTKNVTTMYRMFYRCLSLPQLDLSSFRTENVEDMSRMFYRCKSLTQLDLTSFDTQNVSDMSSMFRSCDSLTTIYVSDKFVIDEGGYYGYMFSGCEKLVGAVAFDSDETSSDMANYHTGYFKTYCQTGDIKHELYGDTLALDTLTLVDGELLKINAPFTAGLAIHERPLASASAYNRWGTICLPYAIKAPAACQLYTYGGVTYDAGTREHVIVVNEVDTLAAGTPAFFCVRDGDVASVTFSATNAVIADSLADNSADGIDGLYLQGTFNSLQVAEGFVPKDNRMWNAEALTVQNGASANMQGLRAYLAYDPESAAIPAAEKLVFEPGVTTAVTDIETILNSGNVEIYDVNGRRSSTLQPGVNIVRQADGKAVKVLVR